MADLPRPSATASAPASIGNVGVGFDILGLAFDAARDRVTAVREAAPGARLGTVSGLMTDLPGTPATVGAGDALALDVHVVSDLRAPIEEAVVRADLRWPGGSHRWRWEGPVPADEWERRLFGAAVDCVVSVPDAALSSDGLYE